MKIALLGGSFNPLHIGHAMLADTLVTEFGFEKILFVPTYIPPHKIMNTKVTAEERLEMVENFCRKSIHNGNQLFFCEDCEIKRKGTSYTVDTLEYITEKYKVELAGNKPAFVMGEEVASQFYKWKNPERVAELADLYIAFRKPEANGVDLKSNKNQPFGNYSEDYSDESYLKFFPYAYTLVNNPVFPVSSTEIRARVACGKAWRYLVPEAVFQYIDTHNLYGNEK